ncbi:hypothetical protein BKA82DRAFT_3986199, partial [Pisolithus tinctorius]
DRGGCATIRDLLKGIHAFFQTRLARAEVERIVSLGRDNYHLLVDAYRRRTTQRHLGVLRDWEWRDGTWQLNLGLVNPTHRNT